MSYLINNQQRITEVIFAKRNKNYGAYVLRSTYGNTLLKSLTFMLAGISSILALAYVLSDHNIKNALINGGQVIPDDPIRIIEFDNTPKEEPPPPSGSAPKPPGSPGQSASSTVISNEVDSVETSSDPVANTTSTSSTESSSLALPGSVGNGSSAVTSTTSTGGDGKGKGKVKTDLEVDRGPEFEGGLPALYKFISSRLRYPSIAYEESREGTVYVKFVVDEEGKVGDLTVMNHPGYGLEEEALRVVSMLPKFKSPAYLDGAPVKVYYQLPIKFRIR